MKQETLQLLIVGIGYAKGSGKDTVANLLQEHVPFKHKLNPIRVAFADALKHEFAGIMDTTVEEIEKNKPLWRPGLQWYGTEYVQQILGDKLYWVKRLEDRMTYLQRSLHKCVIIPDVRFLHEVEFIKRNGGRLIRVDRGGPRSDKHASEQELTGYVGWHHIIDNNGSMNQLNAKVVELANELLNAYANFNF